MLSFEELVAFCDLSPEQREAIREAGFAESHHRLGKAAREEPPAPPGDPDGESPASS